MKSIRPIWIIAATLLVAAVVCSGQEVRITGLDTSSGQLGFSLAPTGTVSDYSCSVEWRSTLTAGGWTNGWPKPFSTFPQTNGMFYAALPRFFRISCTAGQVSSPTGSTYTVTGVIPSQIADGFISWTNSGVPGLIYHIEQATGTNGLWQGQWASQTNLYAVSTVTNAFSVPLFFRVVTITDSGELPW